MNSSVHYDKTERSAFGMYPDTQVNILHQMVHMMETMRVRTLKNYLYSFQKGIILSCHSLVGLSEMVKITFSVDYIMTRRLNQDCLEHFFGCIRQMGSLNDHPDAVNFKHRFKKYLLGRDASLLSDKSNVTPKV